MTTVVVIMMVEGDYNDYDNDGDDHYDDLKDE